MDSGEASADWIDKSSHLPDIWVCCLKVLDDDEEDDENGDDDDSCDDVGYLVFFLKVFDEEELQLDFQ